MYGFRRSGICWDINWLGLAHSYIKVSGDNNNTGMMFIIITLKLLLMDNIIVAIINNNCNVDENI